MRNVTVLGVLLGLQLAGCATSEPVTGESASPLLFSEMESGTCGELPALDQPEDFCQDFGGVDSIETIDGLYQLRCVEGPAINLYVETGEGFAFIETGDCASSYKVERKAVP